MTDRTSAHRHADVRRLRLLSYEAFNLARVALLAIVAMIVGLPVSLRIVADLSPGVSGAYGDNARFSSRVCTARVFLFVAFRLSRVVTC